MKKRERECVERCTHTQAELSGGRERGREEEEEAERVGHKAQSEEEMGMEWCG